MRVIRVFFAVIGGGALAAVHGALLVDSRAGCGTTLRADIPLPVTAGTGTGRG